VEVSLDGGHLWRQAEIIRHETPTPAGKYWCWVFWTFEVQTVEFARASEVLVRAWDASMNTQPSHLTWNLMGMMNNCHFRIKIHQHVDQQVSTSSPGGIAVALMVAGGLVAAYSLLQL
jgi:nitrate reductase (NAD(P)H)